MASFDIHLPADVDQDGLHAKIDEVCADPLIHGMIVQLPLPSHLDEDAALDRIVSSEGRRRPDAGRPGPAGDAAGPGRARRRRRRARAAAPLRRRRWAARTPSSSAARRSSASRRRSCCSSSNCTVTICHSRTRDLPAMHAPGRHPGRRRRPAARCIDGRARGDGARRDRRRHQPAAERASSATSTSPAVRRRRRLITPVPGGVGPMTIAMLLRNTVAAAERSAGGPSPCASGPLTTSKGPPHRSGAPLACRDGGRVPDEANECAEEDVEWPRGQARPATSRGSPAHCRTASPKRGGARDDADDR